MNPIFFYLVSGTSEAIESIVQTQNLVVQESQDDYQERHDEIQESNTQGKDFQDEVQNYIQSVDEEYSQTKDEENIQDEARENVQEKNSENDHLPSSLSRWMNVKVERV
ncbi:hypothetical protein BD770DRAFT_414536 [Pilaira anomala]|nr:hypothetical protein BD770DRAFT_414536 [Pilaira anomala]